MSQQQPIRVVIERKGGCLSGCGTALAVMLLLGLTIQYWYVALPIVVIVAFAAISNAKTQRRKTGAVLRLALIVDPLGDGLPAPGVCAAPDRDRVVPAE